MSAEQQPKGDPILVRVEKDHPLASKGEIQVWNKAGGIHRKQQGGPYVQDAKSFQTIQVPDENNTFHAEHFRKSLRRSEWDAAGQEDLARELSQLPLRGDRVIAKVGDEYLEGEIDDYYTVEGVKYAAFKDSEGNRHGTFLDSLNPEAQADLLKAKETHDAEEKGEVALEASGVEEPEGSPYAYEASLARRSLSMGSREAPVMFDELEDAIRSVQFEQAPGEVLQGRRIGQFYENGKGYSIVELSQGSRLRAAELGAQAIVPDEYLQPATIRAESAPIDEDTIERPSGIEEESSTSKMSDQEYLEKMVEGLEPDDEHHLQMYAIAEADKIAAQKSGDGDGSRSAQESMGWHLKRMSDAAQDIKARYSDRYRHMNKL